MAIMLQITEIEWIWREEDCFEMFLEESIYIGLASTQHLDEHQA